MQRLFRADDYIQRMLPTSYPASFFIDLQLLPDMQRITLLWIVVHALNEHLESLTIYVNILKYSLGNNSKSLYLSAHQYLITKYPAFFLIRSNIFVPISKVELIPLFSLNCIYQINSIQTYMYIYLLILLLCYHMNHGMKITNRNFFSVKLNLASVNTSAQFYIEKIRKKREKCWSHTD